MRLKGRLDKESKKATYDVLVYDSGVGGLSIAREIRRHLPAATLLYVSDSAAFPYGTKEADWLVERVHKVLTQVLTRYQPRTFVMACNTASTIVLPSIRGRYPQPVVGVVPAIKPAALLSQKKSIGILATPATISRDYTENLIASFAGDCQVIKIGSSRLVSLAEDKLRGLALDDDELRAILAPFFKDGQALIDVAVLGCTHFPLLKSDLQRAVPSKIQWLDSGEAVARRLAGVLPDVGADRVSLEDVAICTSTQNEMASLARSFNHFGFARLEVLACD